MTALLHMPHALASGEVIKHALAGSALEQFEPACHQLPVTAAGEAGEREVASAFCTRLREEKAVSARRRERRPQLTQQLLQRAAT